MGHSLQLAQKDVIASPMVFLTGPRQVGKTSLARQVVAREFNWDTSETKKEFLKDPYFFRGKKEWILFDEIHKRKDWKRLLKGYYDSKDRHENFLVTGSGRFNLYQKGGDSLQGRYELYHLYPVTYDEWRLAKGNFVEPRDFSEWEPPGIRPESDTDLLRMGGFPAPLISGESRVLNRWLDQYLRRLIQEDVRDFSRIEQLDKMELLARLLPDRVGSPLSHQSLAEDLECSRETIKVWIRLFEVLFLGFSVKPYSRKIHRAVKKEAKWYFFQWAYVKEASSLFENYLAVQLLTVCQYWRDQGFGTYELYYLRDQDRREVDFLICKDLKPIVIIEAKNQFQDFPSSLAYFAKKLSVPAFLVYPDGPVKRLKQEQWAVPSSVFLKGLTV